MKTTITIIFPDILGGVAQLVKNLISYFPEGNFVFNLILTEQSNKQHTSANYLFKSFSVKNFYYNAFENRYFVHKRLVKLISKNTDIIIANDWLELETIATQKVNKKTVFILHGDYDYYYDLAIKYQGIIDVFITVSKHIEKKLILKLTERSNDIKYLKSIIADPDKDLQQKKRNKFNAIFVGRLSEEKGYFDLETIDEFLKKRNIVINWTIVGAKVYNEKRYSWLQQDNVNWLGTLSNKQVFQEYNKNTFFIFPSKAEGLGMVIVEAMKCGCIPLVSKLDAGIPEFVINGKTGYMIDIGDINSYGLRIIELVLSESKRINMSNNAISISNKLFNPKKNAYQYYVLLNNLNKQKASLKIYPNIKFSKLDKEYLPNFFVKFVRTIIKHPKV